MRISIPTISSSIQTLLGGKKYDRLTNDKEINFYRFTLQNLGKTNIFIENGEDATVENGYLIYPGNSVEIRSDKINKIFLISEKTENDNIRIITT